jgi:ribosomal protein S18 acetylase RimI-like enzyme
MKQILSVKSKKDLTRFIDFPHDLYKDDPNYVPEIFIGQRDLLTPGKHPFYEHSSAQLFLALDGEKITGRIAAIHNKNHNVFTSAQDGFFGFFDCIDDQKTADGLLEAAENWLKEKGLNHIIGPANPTTNDACGILVEGFDSPPMAMMTYNAPYYDRLLKNRGFVKKTDLLAYELNVADANDRAVKLIDVLESRLKRSGIVIRNVDVKKFKEEVPKIREVYNKAWDKNLGFVPMTDKEFDFLARDLKMILDPKYCMVAEKDGEVVGFIVGIPDINQVLITMRRGRLLPTGIFKLLFQKKNITRLRVLTLGVLNEYRKLGIEACLYGRVIKNTYGTKITGGECSWMLEDNYLMNHAIEQINGQLYKRYRLLEKRL